MQPRHGAVDRNLLTKLAPCRWHPFGLGLGANVLVGGSHRISAAAVGLRPGWCQFGAGGGPADATINGGLFRSIRAAAKANDPVSSRPDEKELAISLSVLSVACAIGAAVSFLRYDSKHFELRVLSGVTFLSAAIPSFEGDASLEEMKSIIV